MQLLPDAVKSFHCPRWAELPALPLYMDQVMIVLQDALGIFAEEGEAVATPTMINNYVKQKIVPPPERKKYSKSHVATLIVISIFKKVLSMAEIREIVEVLVDETDMETAYNLFCERLEQLLIHAFAEESRYIEIVPRRNEVPDILNAALTALIGKLLVQDYLFAQAAARQEAQPEE